jgi:hypothetical protein
MLVGKGTTAADEVLARVETILRNEKVSWYKVVAKISVHGPTPRDAKQKVLLFFPPCESAAAKGIKGIDLNLHHDKLIRKVALSKTTWQDEDQLPL